jgi:signal transduction histidine kinase
VTPVPPASRGPAFPVLIEDASVDGIFHSGQGRIGIPPGARSIQLRYTALTLSNAETVRFRYRLEGIDNDWVEADKRRIAFYNNLKPGTYQFRVEASTGGEQWQESPALVLEQFPFFYQTWWFMLLASSAVLSLAFLVYLHRVQQITREFNARLEERVSERTRIARDLHDTMLQSFQGALLKFQAVRYMLPGRPAEAGNALDSVIEQARAAIAEGRSAIQGLRSSTLVSNDLARSITQVGEGIAADQAGGNSPEFRVLVVGASRDLMPIVRDEVYRIVIEALRNSFRHAQAKRIELEICYQKRRLQLRIRDDGKGIDPQVLDAGRRAGHHGLPGMHERAKLVGGKLSVWSRPDAGTEIELSIPGFLAYTKSPDHRSVASGQASD